MFFISICQQRRKEKKKLEKVGGGGDGRANGNTNNYDNNGISGQVSHTDPEAEVRTCKNILCNNYDLDTDNIVTMHLYWVFFLDSHGSFSILSDNLIMPIFTYISFVVNL